MPQPKINPNSPKHSSLLQKILMVICSVAVTSFSVYLIAYAGTINSSDSPSNDMYSMESIYQKLHNGTTASSPSGAFVEPASAPGSTMHTLNDLYNDFNTDVSSTSGTTASSVLSGKTFFDTAGTTRGTNWGPVAGTIANCAADNGGTCYVSQSSKSSLDTNLIAGNIKSGVAIFGVTGNAASGTLPATSQTVVYTTNDDGTYQKGLARSNTNVTVNSLKVAVTDNNTGLMWQRCATGLSGDDCATGSAATKNFTNSILNCENLELCNDGTYQGDQTGEGDCTSHSGALYTDWRLPNVNELLSLVNYLYFNPPVDPTFFPNTQSLDHWSSTTVSGHSSSGWTVYFGDGYSNDGSKSSASAVRCVRGG